MPNRLLREGILTSQRVNALSPETEVFYRRLMSLVDDFGRYTAHPALLRAALYPLQLDRVREASMERHLAECEKARLVRLYVHEGKGYLELLDFNQHVRAKTSKYPHPPDGCMTDAVHQQRRCMTDAPGDGDGDEYPQNPQGGEGGQGKEKTKTAEAEERAAAKVAEQTHAQSFAAFWKAYPNKVGKVPAEKAWRRHRCAEQIDVILQALERHKQDERWRKDNGQFIPHPATWLNQQRWTDEGLERIAAPPLRAAPKPVPADWEEFKTALARKYPARSPAIKCWDSWEDAERDLRPVAEEYQSWRAEGVLQLT